MVRVKKQFISHDYSFINLASKDDDYTFGYMDGQAYVLFAYYGKPKIVGRYNNANAIRFVEMFLKMDFESEDDKLKTEKFLDFMKMAHR